MARGCWHNASAACTHGTLSLPSESHIRRDRGVRLTPQCRVRRRRDTYHQGCFIRECTAIESLHRNSSRWVCAWPLPGKSQWPSSRRRPPTGYRPCVGSSVPPDNASVEQP